MTTTLSMQTNYDIIDAIISFDGRYIKEYLWAYGDGSFSICDEDGNHEDVEESDIEELLAGDRSTKYIEQVAKTGEDYLGMFFVNKTREVRPKIYIGCKSWVGQKTIGQKVDSVRVSNTKFKGNYKPCECPKEIAEYICLEERGEGNFVLDGVTDEVVSGNEDITINANPCLDGSGKFIIEVQADIVIERNHEEVKKETIELAKKSLTKHNH